MNKYWKWIISAAIAATCVLFTVIAFNAEEVLAFPIMIGIDLLVVLFFIYMYFKTKKHENT